MNEFAIIEQYFASQHLSRPDVVLGIGDDAAIVNIADNEQLVITTDTLLEGVHFPVQTSAYHIGYKALAVNLSDLAAMGATPAWVTLSISLPTQDLDWLQNFCAGFFTLANRYNVMLIGGDTTRGPLAITVQALGTVPKQHFIPRHGAKAQDLIYVTGTLGDAGYALKLLDTPTSSIDPAYQKIFLERLNHPEPRVATGIALRQIASAAIDISDGFAADLNHLLKRSNVGANIIVDDVPLSPALKHCLAASKAIELALTAGDDYELCFTVPPAKRELMETHLNTIACRYTLVGEITAGKKVNYCYQNGSSYHGELSGYKHF